MNAILYLNVLCSVQIWQCFLKIFILVKKDVSFPKYANGGGGEVAVLNGVRASFFETFIFFFQIRMKNGTKSVWDYPTLFLWDHPTFFSIYPTSIPQKDVVHFCLKRYFYVKGGTKDQDTFQCNYFIAFE